MAQVRRLNLRPIEQISGQEEGVGFLGNRLVRDEIKSIGKIRVWQPPLQPPASQMNIRRVDKFHGSEVHCPPDGIFDFRYNQRIEPASALG
ncbi:hypothetical protein SBV1_770051 [Verrucomicrobia bacterium]|nr:hypothetical protein SBV1_770051 [Verrucomicrobiota bacterium]